MKNERMTEGKERMTEGGAAIHYRNYSLYCVVPVLHNSESRYYVYETLEAYSLSLTTEVRTFCRQQEFGSVTYRNLPLRRKPLTIIHNYGDL